MGYGPWVYKVSWASGPALNLQVSDKAADDSCDHRLPRARVAQEAHVEALALQGLQARALA